MAADPVAARLPAAHRLKAPAPPDTAMLTLPVRSPAVTRIRLLLAASPAALHSAEVSEYQTDSSQAVRPRPCDCEASSSAIPAPCTVMAADPVDGMLEMLLELAHAASREAPSDRVATISPPVTTIRLVPTVPCARWHLTPVSDIQDVSSHAVCPTAPIAVCAASPTCPPRKDMYADPVAA